jgi:hypothetical protein
MKKFAWFILFCTLLSFSPSFIITCPLCVGRLDKEQKTPTFFSDEYEKYWQLSHQENAHLLKDIHDTNDHEDKKENS